MWKLVTAILVLLAIIVFTILSYLGYSRDPAERYMKEGLLQFQQHHYDSAIRNYERAVAAGAKSPIAYNMLGLAYRYKDQQLKVCDPKLEESEIVYFEKAVEVDPGYLPAIINLAYTYYARGHKHRAAALFKKALELKPDDPDRVQWEKLMAEGIKPPGPPTAAKRHHIR